MRKQRWLIAAAIVALLGLAAIITTGCEDDQEKADPTQKTTTADRDSRDRPLKEKRDGDRKLEEDQKAPGEPIKTDQASFEADVLRSPVPVMVDFYADWCPPCRTLSPRLEELAADYGGRAVVAKVDVDENGDLAREYGVRGIPALFVIKDGEVVEQAVGLKSKQELAAMLDRHID